MKIPRLFFRWLCLLIVVPFLAACAGCNLIAAPLSIMAQDQTKKVPAEYADLSGKNLTIWVWADESLLFEYPVIQKDTANHARYFLLQHVKNVKITDIDAVDRFQRSNYDADTLPVPQVGRKFNADAVLFIQVSEFVTRPAGAPNLFQGRMNTQCALYDCKGDLPVESPNRKLWSGAVSVVYPERPVGLMDSNDLTIRSVLLKLFGEALAKKFYEHQVPVGDK